MAAPKPRLAAVAEMAGVSRATASKALNGRADVSEQTRQRVLEAARELEYQSGPVPTSDAVPLIALVADNMDTNYTLDIMRGATTTAMTLGVGLVVHYAEGVHPGVQPLSDDWFERVAADRWLGIVVLTTKMSKHQLDVINRLGLNFLAIDPANRLPADTTSIGATNWNGGVEATEHLIGLGHKRIAFINGTSGSVPSSERLQGYLSALTMHDLPHDPSLVTGEMFSHEAGLEAGLRLLKMPPSRRPTAIFAASDLIAVGVYQAARQLGMHVPDDVSVVGFDDTDLATLVTPPLSTVRQPLPEMGATAIRTLVDISRGRAVTGGPMRLATQLMVRSSTGAPPRR